MASDPLLLLSVSQSAVLNLQAKVALLDADHIATIGAQLQVMPLIKDLPTKDKPK